MRRFGQDHHSYIDRRDSAASTGTDDDEIVANEFAATLLVPEDVVRKRHVEKAGTVELAYEFRVSEEALT